MSQDTETKETAPGSPGEYEEHYEDLDDGAGCTEIWTYSNDCRDE